MKQNILKNIILTLITGMAMLAHGGAAPVASVNALQPDFPKIILQPEDQMAYFGSNAVFTVTAANTESYLWGEEYRGD